MKNPNRNRVKKIISPGIWEDMNGCLHFNIPDLLKMFDLEDTPENHRIAIENVKQVIREQSPEAQINVRKSPEE